MTRKMIFRKSKKAQLTIIIITGIVLLMAVAMVIWLGSQTATKHTKGAAEQQRLRQVAVQPVREYINSCLDVTTMTGLDLLGKQGGVLYRSQGGLTPDVIPSNIGSYVVYDGLNVSYTITRPTQDIAKLYFAQPPEYPYTSFPYIFNESSKSIVKEFYGGYYGKSLLPPLFKPGKDSIQEQLESYISFNLPRCTDWKGFASSGLSITAGVPNVTVMIAENRTQIETEQFFTVLVSWQVNVTDLTTSGNTTISEFSLGYPLHLAKFYLFVQGIVFGEVNDATFNPLNLSAEATPVFVIKDVFTNPVDKGTDDIIIVQDAESVLRGKPFEFRILRGNRYPALVWINQTSLDKYRFIPFGYCDQKNPKQSIFLADNHLAIKGPDTWETDLRAIDPDEDIVTFSMKPPQGVITSKPGEIFSLYIYASDGGEIQDYQILNVSTGSCPQE